MPTARHLSSKIQPWNCDQSVLMLSNRDARFGLVFLDGLTHTPLFQRAAPGTEVRWMPDSSDHLFYVYQQTMGLWNVQANTTQVLHQFSDLTNLHIGPYEGNLSQDGKRVVVTGETPTGVAISVLFDLENLVEVARYAHPPGLSVDWISVSASGRYVVLNGESSPGDIDRTQIFDTQFNPVTQFLEYGRPSHYDLMLDAQGEDIAVGVSKSQPDDGHVIARRLRDGQVTSLTNEGYASHTSGRNTRQAGWVFVTYQGLLPNHPPYSNEVVAVRTDGSGTVSRLASFPDAGSDYWGQPQAVPSWDGTSMLWAQVWPGTTHIGTAGASTGLVNRGGPACAP